MIRLTILFIALMWACFALAEHIAPSNCQSETCHYQMHY